MLTLNDPPALRCGERVYLWLLRVYPAAFRHEYGAPIAQAFRDQCREAHRRSGMWGLCATWLGAGWDLGKSATLEHLSTMKGKLFMSDRPLMPHSRRRWMVGAFTLVCGATILLTWWMPRFYASTTRIAVHKAKPNADPALAAGPQALYDPFFVHTEFERLRSGEVLNQVIKSLELKKHWARKYDLPAVSDAQAQAILRKRLDLRLVRDTSLIEIRVLNEDSREAAAIANCIAAEYGRLRTEHLQLATLRGVKELEARLKEQGDKVELAARKVAELREHNRGTELLVEGREEGSGANNHLQQLKSQADQALLELQQTRALVGRLRSLEYSRLIALLPTVLPDTLLTELLSRRNQAEMNAAAIEKDYGPEHPDRVKAQALLTAISRQVNERVDGILAGLDFKAGSLAETARSGQAAYEEATKSATEQSQKYQTFATAKRDLEFERQIRQTLAMKLAQEQLAIRQQEFNPVEVVDYAEPGVRPVLPNWPLNVVKGVIGGLLASLILGAIFAAKGFWRDRPAAS